MGIENSVFGKHGLPMFCAIDLIASRTDWAKFISNNTRDLEGAVVCWVGFDFGQNRLGIVNVERITYFFY
ncbi:TPA: hypothetical protein EYO77_09630 [Candidatus Poribacteria bacterium]|nr:hypothetical protein [Candidatus Poribacteria bacterium]